MHRPTDILDDMIDLRDAYATLPENYRRVVYLYFELNWKQCEIARALNIRQQSVQELLQKALIYLNNL